MMNSETNKETAKMETIELNCKKYVRCDTENIHPIRIGNKVLIRTVTYHHLGVVTRITPESVILTEASWLADSGPFSEALRTGNVSEVEVIPAPGVAAVERATIVDSYDWIHTLPKVTK